MHRPLQVQSKEGCLCFYKLSPLLFNKTLALLQNLYLTSGTQGKSSIGFTFCVNVNNDVTDMSANVNREKPNELHE